MIGRKNRGIWGPVPVEGLLGGIEILRKEKIETWKTGRDLWSRKGLGPKGNSQLYTITGGQLYQVAILPTAQDLLQSKSTCYLKERV